MTRDLTLLIQAKNQTDKALRDLQRAHTQTAKRIAAGFKGAAATTTTAWKRTFQELQRGFEKTKTKAVAAFGRIGKAFDRIATVKSAAVVAALAGIGRAMFSLGQQAAIFRDVERGYHTMVTKMRVDSQDLLKRMRAMTQGTVDSLTLMQQANTAVMLGLPLDQFDKLLAIARNAAIQTGQSMDFMLQSIVTGIGRQSKLILDNLGIIVSVEKANAKYAQALGKTAQALTDAEKKQAFLNEVVAAGERQIKMAGDAADSAVAPFQRFTAAMKDLGVTIGEQVRGEVSWALEAFTKLARLGETAIKTPIYTGSLAAQARGVQPLSAAEFDANTLLIRKIDSVVDEWMDVTGALDRASRTWNDAGMQVSTLMTGRHPVSVRGAAPPTVIQPTLAAGPAFAAQRRAQLGMDVRRGGMVTPVAQPTVIQGTRGQAVETFRGMQLTPVTQPAVIQPMRPGVTPTPMTTPQVASHGRAVSTGMNMKRTREQLGLAPLEQAVQVTQQASQQMANSVVGAWAQISASTQTMADDVVTVFLDTTMTVMNLMRMMQQAQAGSALSWLGPIGIGLAGVGAIAQLSSMADKPRYSHATR